MRNGRAVLVRPPGALSRADRMALWRSGYVRRQPRPSSAARGYDADWQALRKAHLEQEPFCRHCRQRGIERRAETVDHIETIRNAPERRLDPTNLQSLCWPCHRRKDQGFRKKSQ